MDKHRIEKVYIFHSLFHGPWNTRFPFANISFLDQDIAQYIKKEVRVRLFFFSYSAPT